MSSATPAKIIFDTDVGYLNDDSIAMMVALASNELDVLGITVVAGNFDRDQEVVDALSMLDRLERLDVPVFAGADRPLVHTRGEYPLGRPPRAEADSRSAAEFIVEAVRANPGEVTILAVGPLTNLAVAFAQDPELEALVKQLVVMGGSVASFPNGSGNCTPTAEFNFFVDPEAAAAVLNTSIPTLLVPLNVTRPVTYTGDFHCQLLAKAGIAADLLTERMGDFFAAGTDDRETVDFSHYGLCDSTAVIAAIRPELFDIVTAQAQIDLSNGPAYGTSYIYVRGELSASALAGHEGIWHAWVQPADLWGAVSDPTTLDVAIRVDHEAVSTECLQRLMTLSPHSGAAR